MEAALNPIRLAIEVGQLKHKLAMKEVALAELARERDFWRTELDAAQRLNARLRRRIEELIGESAAPQPIGRRSAEAC